jgi:hypothetical protein
VAKKKPEGKEVTEDRLIDARKRADEMVEGVSPAQTAAIYRKGDKYYCAECNVQLPVHQSCPTCHLHIDWDRALADIRPTP